MYAIYTCPVGAPIDHPWSLFDFYESRQVATAVAAALKSKGELLVCVEWDEEI